MPARTTTDTTPKNEHAKSTNGISPEVTELKDTIIETRHSLTIQGRTIRYTARAGTMVLKEETEGEGEKSGLSEGEKARATIFFISYTQDGADASRPRPITFAFNGGPGSSSVWLHLGVFGPRRVQMSGSTAPMPPPYRLVDNDQSILDQTDLVFIDPVSTGYSRVVAGDKAKDFHGFTKDIESVGDFIRLYTTRYNRWNSPKYLAGESYGSTRAAGLAGYLHERHGMYLNGIILVSAVLNFQTVDAQPGNDLPYILHLPTYTASAWFHNRLDDDLQHNLHDTLKEAEQFARTEYTLALMQGAALPAEEREQIVRKLARYTGLSPSYLGRCDLRPEIMRFTKELLRDQGRTVGRLDSRFTGSDRDAAGEQPEFDPSMAAITGPYTALIYDYVRGSLKFESDLTYEVLTGRVSPWNVKEFENRYIDVADTLRKAMRMNPHLRVYIASGYYDLATPYFATDYTVNHLGLDAEAQKNISMGYYEAGHMMYIHPESLAKMKRELSQFIHSAIPSVETGLVVK
ncbi:MAG: peptidase S10 [Chloroflexaceae bacterium]|jgi:carboxypeptidase C (cathepsin A)|nr:peptidase S10 [Chloroflexaceae bacterium]